ncbi:CrcB family protein [Planomicrobium sp. CPCC 101110]|uniref:fluoride efflux transporter FluC n=1 Tax=Planomicrobium sp. CPCC 101110 TaxID=2599619 RepID=UPI0011B5C9FF|nr:CrcB family protein [Planomicrobium sp. CPCC 101110]TWT24654.1 CrcB family protein [Planomicrobium sp. CPCC 101110]
MNRILAVGFGGMAGALLRTWIYAAVPGGFGIWTVNLAGSFLIGAAAAKLAGKPAELRLFVSTGLIGSFTTFSAFSSDWFHYLERSLMEGIAFAVCMTAGSIAAAAFGLWAGRKGGRL